MCIGPGAQPADVAARHEGDSEDVAQPAARRRGPALPLGRHLHLAPAPLPVHRVALRGAARPRLQPQDARRARQCAGTHARTHARIRIRTHVRTYTRMHTHSRT